MKRLYAVLLVFWLAISVACGSAAPGTPSTRATKPPRPGTSTPAAPTSSPSRVVIESRPVKMIQLVGEEDRERHVPSASQSWTRYKLAGTDLGVPFTHKGVTYLLFGDTIGFRRGDAIGYTSDNNPEDGLELIFLHDQNGYLPVTIPGISQGAFEVPMEGISLGSKMYIYHTTDSSTASQIDRDEARMGRSVLAVSADDGYSFTYLYDVSTDKFINVSVVQVNPADWVGFPDSSSAGLAIFGSGDYRRDVVYLAYQPTAQIEQRGSYRYFSGLDASGRPGWSTEESKAQPLTDQPCVGEFSVSYNRFIRKWIMLYNCFLPASRGINLRTADRPWGPWSPPEILFQPWDDGGYCHFMHASWSSQKCDEVHEPGREDVWAGEYGPYQFEDWATGDSNRTTIYFTLSTWNPYTVVLMKATLRRGN